MDLYLWIEIAEIFIFLCCYLWVIHTESALSFLSEQIRSVNLKSEDAEVETVQQNRINHSLAILLILRYFFLISIVCLAFIVTYQISLINSSFSKNGIFAIITISTLFLLFVAQQIIRRSKKNIPEKALRRKQEVLKIIHKIPVLSFPGELLKNLADKKINSVIRKNSENSFDDIEQALALSKVEGRPMEDQKILEGIVKYGSTDACQIMRSRMDVIAFDEKLSYNEVMELIKEHGYSRIPVYRDRFDQVIGILFIKDLLPHIDEKENFKWQKLIRKPLFVPQNKKIDDLLREFQAKKMHMAVLIDEYGGASGIVTLEDILEEIVGDITDEYDDEIVINRIDEDTVIFEGRTPLMDFYKTMEIDGTNFEAQKRDSETLAGFMVQKAGKILRNNEYLIVDNIKLIVESSDKKRIKSIKSVVLKSSSKE